MLSRKLSDRRDVTDKDNLPGKRRSSPIAAVLLALALTAIPAAAWAQNSATARETIAVEGNRRIDADTVRSYFHPNADGRYDEAVRDAALKALIATGLFADVKIEHTGEHLVVHLTEAPVI